MLNLVGSFINKICHTYTENFSYDFLEETNAALQKNVLSYSSRRQIKNDFNSFKFWKLKKVNNKFSLVFLSHFTIANLSHSKRLNRKLKMVTYSVVRGFLFLLINNSRFYLVFDESDRFFGILSFYTDGRLLHWAQGISTDKRNLSSLGIYLSIALATRMNIRLISLGPTNDETKKRRGFNKTTLEALRSMRSFEKIPFDILIKSESDSLADMFEFLSMTA